MNTPIYFSYSKFKTSQIHTTSDGMELEKLLLNNITIDKKKTGTRGLDVCISTNYSKYPYVEEIFRKTHLDSILEKNDNAILSFYGVDVRRTLIGDGRIGFEYLEKNNPFSKGYIAKKHISPDSSITICFERKPWVPEDIEFRRNARLPAIVYGIEKGYCFKRNPDPEKNPDIFYCQSFVGFDEETVEIAGGYGVTMKDDLPVTILLKRTGESKNKHEEILRFVGAPLETGKWIKKAFWDDE